MTALDELERLERELGDRLGETFDACLGGVCLGDRPRTNPPARRHVPPRRRSNPRPRRSRMWLGTAAALVLVTVGVAALIERSGTTPAPAAPGAIVGSGSAADHGSAVAEPSSPAAPPASPAPAATEPTMHLPAFVPPGYVLDDVSLGVADTPIPPGWSGPRAVYVRRVDGTITAAVVVSSQPTPPEHEPGQGTFTVRGMPADVYDSGDGLVAYWVEGDHLVEVHATGLSVEETTAIAEHVTVSAGGEVSLPADLEWEPLTLPARPPADAPTPALQYRRGDDPSDMITIVRWPHHSGEPLELMAFRNAENGWNVETATVRGLPAVTMSFTGRPGEMVYLHWLDGDGHWLISARLPAPVLVQIANGLVPSSLDDARSWLTELDDQLLATPERDRITLANGFELSVHEIGSGPGALCVRRPTTVCERSPNGGTAQGEPTIVVSMVIDGQTWIVGWMEGDHEPTLFGSAGQPVASVVDGIAGSIVERTDVGTFVAMPTTSVQFSFDRSSGQIVGLTVGSSDLLRGAGAGRRSSAGGRRGTAGVLR